MAKGRPRTFDETEAIESATLSFWNRGYQATTFDDLTDAMALNRPSVYAAFGEEDGSVFQEEGMRACGELCF